MANQQGDLNGKVVFVGGGAGNIGGISVRGSLRAGATVVTASRDEKRFDRLRRFIDQDGLDQSKLITLVGNLGSEAEAQSLAAGVFERVGVPDAVIASLGGGMEPASLLSMPLESWYEVMDNNLTSHLLAARVFLPPMLKRGSGTYIIVSGYGGVVAWPNGAPVSIAAAAGISLGRNLAAENHGKGVRISTMVLATGGSDMWARLAHTPGAYQGEDVGDFMAWLVSPDGDVAQESTLYYVTDWQKANAILHA